MGKIIKSLKRAFMIRRGDIINHPTFGRVKVLDIYAKKGDYDLFCELLDYNNTHKIFSALDMNKLKYKQKARLRLVE